MYTYKPKRFYFQVFIATWSFWLIAISGSSSPFIFIYQPRYVFEKRHIGHILEWI